MGQPGPPPQLPPPRSQSIMTDVVGQILPHPKTKAVVPQAENRKWKSGNSPHLE